MNIRGYELITEWEVSNIGHTALAQKGKKKYFLKRYGEYKMPRHDASVTPSLYARLMSEFEPFRDNRVAINEALKELAGPGGNIILPTDWFVEDIFYIEATEFVDDLIEDKEILKLSEEEKLFIMLTAAGALLNIHRKNIVHSDLKRTNILAAKNSAGKIVAKIIDFDRSYFADKVRRLELGGDFNFMSPELAQCIMCGCTEEGDPTEEMEEAISYLSTKSDIFSLGLVFHDYLADGEHPRIEGLTGPLKARADKGKTVYCGEALLNGGKLIVSDKIKEKYLSHLIAAMLQLEPDDRPSAQEVLDVLKTKRVLELKSDSPVKIAGEPEVIPSEPTDTEDGEEETAIPSGFCEPWDDHKIVFAADKLLSGGFVASERVDHKGIKCYALYKRDGGKRIFTPETLLMLRMATRAGSAGASDKRDTPHESEKPTPTSDITIYDDGELWGSDGAYKFDMAAIRRGGYIGAARAERKGLKGYVLIKNADVKRFMTFSTLRQLGFVVAK